MDAQETLSTLEARAVAQATSDWFEKDPYVRAVYSHLSPDERNSIIEKVSTEAASEGFMQLDAGKWLAHKVNRMYDEGKLPEIREAQLRFQSKAQAMEDAMIQDRKMPIEQVRAYLTAGYRDPAIAKMRQEEDVAINKQFREAVEAGLIAPESQDHIFPG